VIQVLGQVSRVINCCLQWQPTFDETLKLFLVYDCYGWERVLLSSTVI
jgi:hypothetical protein